MHSTLLVASAEHIIPHECNSAHGVWEAGRRASTESTPVRCAQTVGSGAAGTIGDAAECVRSSGLPDSPAARREEAQTAGDTTGRVGDLDSPDSAPASLPLRPAH